MNERTFPRSSKDPVIYRSNRPVETNNLFIHNNIMGVCSFSWTWRKMLMSARFCGVYAR